MLLSALLDSAVRRPDAANRYAKKVATVSELLAQARIALVDVPREALGVEKVGRFRGTRFVRAGSAWHLGVLLLTDDGVLATGEVLRAAAAVRRGYPAESARARAERRAQARKGGFAEGEVVHLGWVAVDIAAVERGGESGPLLMTDGVPMVRWSAAAQPRELAGHLQEQVELATSV